MTDREKLIDLVREGYAKAIWNRGDIISTITYHLIENGVTVPELAEGGVE